MEIQTLEFTGKKMQMTAEFQPIIQLSGNKILRYEVLARFFNAEGFLIPAQQITPELTHPQTLFQVCDFIIASACNLLKLKSALVISFKLPAQLMGNMEYLAGIYKRSLQNNVAPQNLEITISEKILKAPLINYVTYLRQAKEYGFLLALDEAKPGAIPASTLSQLSFDTIHLDRAMIENIHQDAATFTALRRCIGPLISAGITVFCTGIAKSADLHFLQKHPSPGIQGYALSRPLTYSQLRLLEGL
ncbi:EAL domain-containing protein [Kosakonia sp. BK9b]